jgi:hypothetical protein
MQNKKGKVVVEPKDGAKKVLTPRAPIIGETETNFICGKCNTMLVKGFDPAKFKNNVVKCMNCDNFNEV